jgi:hypothetical protein
MVLIAQRRDEVHQRSVQRKEAEAIRYNRRISNKILAIGDLVILYQKKTEKLEAR